MSLGDGAFIGGESDDEFISSDTTCSDLGIEDDSQAWTETEADNINPADSLEA